MQARYDGLADWYDAWLTGDDGAITAFAGAAMRMLADLTGPGEGVVLDVGCGTGSPTIAEDGNVAGSPKLRRVPGSVRTVEL